MMEFKGVLKLKGETVQVSERFKKRDFVITEDRDQYPQVVSFQLNQDRCDSLDNVNVGDMVTVRFGLNGRAWTNPTTGETKYFNTLVAFSIVKEGGVSTNPITTQIHPTDAFDETLGF